MKISTALVKEGTRGLDSLRVDYTEEENIEALAALKANPKYSPLNGMVAESFAGQAKQMLDKGFPELSYIRRKQTIGYVETLVAGSSWDKSKKAIMSECDMDRKALGDIELKWPFMYHFINLLILELIIPISFGRVLHSTADAAIHGTDRDRRLYYELFAGLKQKDKGSGGTSVIFINDNMSRPSDTVINVTPRPEDLEE